MTAARLVQNFRGVRALLAVADAGAVETVAGTLKKLGAVVSVTSPDLLTREMLAGFDVLFLDLDLGIPEGCAWARLGQAPPLPVVGIVGVEAPSQLKALLQLGVTAHLRKPVQGASVYAALYLGINEFNRRRSVEGRLAAAEERRRGRRFVIKAVLQVMSQRSVNDDEAFQILRRESMKKQLSVEAFSEEIIRKTLEEGIAGVNAERG
ncbi:ANTAR domain-containing protein (plasmid) [Skermanella rosea]|uniref:ANTAR domain-containing response regulator n=1 Tax=Skermanella rosea TaxID=1817965 RepID=UPI0019326016|nr:ANTAR domain-containing protein [Skermanella rosea]UEM07817.1 ANTAR domain-containing protein [Skermanella rosea]